jgi:hypothetical protein
MEVKLSKLFCLVNYPSPKFLELLAAEGFSQRRKRVSWKDSETLSFRSGAILAQH